jgi:hypothetical protein
VEFYLQQLPLLLLLLLLPDSLLLLLLLLPDSLQLHHLPSMKWFWCWCQLSKAEFLFQKGLPTENHLQCSKKIERRQRGTLILMRTMVKVAKVPPHFSQITMKLSTTSLLSQQQPARSPPEYFPLRFACGGQATVAAHCCTAPLHLCLPHTVPLPQTTTASGSKD